MEVQPQDIRNYLSSDGKDIFSEWFDSLRDRRAKAKIRARLDRVEEGNLGDYKSVGDGVFELKIDYASGYRIYFGQEGSAIIILLCGGDKSTQDKDITKAKKYWQDYRSRDDA
ncbi:MULTISPECIES: type II toxin-antitoxin system RelE/ParE family toxin [Calothrix]|uniref:Type II toxin-antitoxin system RelE/ParE family toxin n=2 Tax=Calothrix TaxID=1186 RepID=A0ABR8AJW0_9CYAN|nr:MULTISPECIES: type II toxin-antitoxin system RelE/ParE family toxin [Calothrix]MBD2200297.1 type II toxin-antitoxin system RelE/ParE family toxin [Calothrix parietina FACHB-288]MBD2224294.1 type II toxin-antitoxin system RelE/ParE family toxin [Calothrix anomala FACHB-343]